MLIQFNFSNYKSFKDQVSLDMIATSIKEHPYNIITNEKGGEYIKVAAIYGANASGKTSVMEAFGFMRYWVLNSFKRESEKEGIPIKRFAFDKISKNGRAEFEVFFENRGKEYQYGFSIDNKKVYEEWLYKRDYRGKEKYIPLFERVNDKIQCGDSLKTANNFISLVEDATLFLSIISNAKIREAKEIQDWFRNTVVMDLRNADLESILSRSLPSYIHDEQYLKEIESFLKAIDININGIRVEETNSNINDESSKSYRVFSKHKMIDGNGDYEIPFQEESSGTQKMFYLYNFLVSSIRNGYTILIDELDAKLHPLLLRYIINMFHNPEINKKKAQLIYSTHDIYTLTKETFRRDEIWFTEKDFRGVSDLYSLAELKLDNDMKVRNDATYNKDYLLGRYGAIPLLKEFNLWEDNHSEENFTRE